MKTNTNQAFRKDIYKNRKALLCHIHYHKNLFRKWFRIFEIFVNNAIQKIPIIQYKNYNKKLSI